MHIQTFIPFVSRCLHPPSTHPHRRPHLTNEDHLLIRISSMSGDIFSNISAHNLEFSNVTDRGLTIAINKARELEKETNAIYLETILRSRVDIEPDELLLQACDQDRDSFWLFFNSPPQWEKISDEALKIGILLLENKHHSHRAHALKDILHSQKSRIKNSFSEKDVELLSVIQADQEDYRQFIDSNPLCRGIQDLALKAASYKAHEIGLIQRSEELLNILHQKEKTHSSFLSQTVEPLSRKEDLEHRFMFSVRSLFPRQYLPVSRLIGGGKDAYFQAVMFALLETLINHPQRQFFCFELASRCEECPLIDSRIRDRFAKGLRLIGNRTLCNAAGSLDNLIKSSTFALDMVAFARGILAAHITKHMGIDVQGKHLSYKDALDSLKPEGGISKKISQIGLLGDALGIGITITEVERDGLFKNHYSFFQSKPIHLHLLQLSDYYALLYPS